MCSTVFCSIYNKEKFSNESVDHLLAVCLSRITAAGDLIFFKKESRPTQEMPQGGGGDKCRRRAKPPPAPMGGRGKGLRKRVLLTEPPDCEIKRKSFLTFPALRRSSQAQTRRQITRGFILFKS